jgi:anti-sigma factor RsiW
MGPNESCERYELDLSALLDGELESDAIPETLEHLRHCSVCHRFFQQLLELDGASGLLKERDTHRMVARSATSRRSPWKMTRNAWVAAAVVLAFLGGWMLPTANLAADVPTRDEVLELSLGEDAGKMADARFVSMAVELLRADPRYHIAMFQMLQDVVIENPTELPSPESFAFPR